MYVTVHVALPDARATASQPGIVALLSEKLTVPVGLDAAPLVAVTLAVNVAGFPILIWFAAGDDVTVVVVVT